MNADIQITRSLCVMEIYNPVKVLALGGRFVVMKGNHLMTIIFQHFGHGLNYLTSFVHLVNVMASPLHILSMATADHELHLLNSSTSWRISSQSSIMAFILPLFIITIQFVPGGKCSCAPFCGVRTDETSWGFMSIT